MTVVVPKGEPSAHNMGRLRLDLTDAERAELRRLMARGPTPPPDIVGRIPDVTDRWPHLDSPLGHTLADVTTEPSKFANYI